MKIYTRYGSHLALFALPFTLLLTGCEEKKSASMDSIPVGSQTNAPVAEADNSAKNVRDRNGSTITPGDQSNAPGDLDTTQKIRQALVSGTNHYSLTARNIKIMTVNNNVTLRGPVTTPEEKAEIVAMAKDVAGPANVDDQLEVEAKP